MFTTKWRKQHYKVADLVFEIPCGMMKNWDGSQFEPMVMGIVFPLAKYRPWQLRNTQNISGSGKETVHTVERGSSLCAESLVQTLQVHKDVGLPVKRYDVGAATDPTPRTLFGFTSPTRMKTDLCGERRETKNDSKSVAMVTT
jgi:hypothetical protein